MNVDESPKRPMPDLDAEVIDRHKELSVGEMFRVLWALKIPSAIVGVALIGSAFTLGRYMTSSGEKPSQYRLDVKVSPFDETLPKLSDAEFDGRSLEEYGTETDRHLEEREALKGLQKTLQSQKSVYADEVGKRFEWSGMVTGLSVAHESPDRKVIAVRIKSGDHEADCLFEEAGNIGRLLSLEIGQTMSVTGVLARHGELVLCEFGSTPDTATTGEVIR